MYNYWKVIDKMLYAKTKDKFRHFPGFNKERIIFTKIVT